MKKTRIFMICCWLVFLSGTLLLVFLSQGRSQHFTGNQFLVTSIIIYIPLYIVTTLALVKLARTEEDE